MANDEAALLKFARVHGLDDLAHLTRVQILEEIVLHDCIFDQLLGSVQSTEKNICYSLLFVTNSVKRFRHLDECMRSALVPFQGFPWISELPFPGRNNRKVCGPSTRRSKRKLILDIALRGRYKRCRPFSSFCDRKPKRISPEYIDLLAPTTFSSAPFRLPAIFTILFNMKSKRKGNKRRIWSLQCN